MALGHSLVEMQRPRRIALGMPILIAAATSLHPEATR